MENPDISPRNLPEAGRNICVCPNCNDKFVQLVDWGNELGEDHMVLSLECPTCGWEYEDVFHQKDISDFEAANDEGITQLTRAYRKIRTTNRYIQAEYSLRGYSLDSVIPKDERFNPHQ